MNFNFVDMNSEYANEIAFNWSYEGLYSFYDMTADEEDLEEFLDEKNWFDSFFAVLDENNALIGYFSIFFEEEIMGIGLGLKHSLTGKRLGREFISAGIAFVLERFEYKKDYITLAVACFNKRAIKTYEKLGFEYVEKYMQKTNGGEYEFIKMKKAL